MNGNGFTKIETRIMSLLSDGMPHRRDEVLDCLGDKLAELSALHAHMTRIRKKINPKGESILCVISGHRYCYQLVKLVSSSYDGRT